MSLLLTPVNARAQAIPVEIFSDVPACPDADVYVTRANNALSQVQSVLPTRFNRALRLMELGDAFTECMKRLTAVTPDDPVNAVAQVEEVLMQGMEARFAGTIALADVIDLSPNAKAKESARYLFAKAANGTLYDVRMITRTSHDEGYLRRASSIEVTVTDMAYKYAGDQITVVYEGLP